MRLWASSFILRLVFFFPPHRNPTWKRKASAAVTCWGSFLLHLPSTQRTPTRLPCSTFFDTTQLWCTVSPHSDPPGGKKNINVIGRRCWQCMPGRKEKEKKVSLPLPPPKLRLCQVTTNRKGRIKTQPPRPPPSTQLKLHGCQLPLTNNYTARLLGHILPGGPSSRKAQLRKPGCDAWGSWNPFQEALRSFVPLCQLLCWKMLVPAREERRTDCRAGNLPTKPPQMLPSSIARLLPPAGSSWGSTAGLRHPPRNLCPTSFHSSQTTMRLAWAGTGSISVLAPELPISSPTSSLPSTQTQSPALPALFGSLLVNSAFQISQWKQASVSCACSHSFQSKILKALSALPMLRSSLISCCGAEFSHLLSLLPGIFPQTSEHKSHPWSRQKARRISSSWTSSPVLPA